MAGTTIGVLKGLKKEGVMLADTEDSEVTGSVIVTEVAMMDWEKQEVLVVSEVPTVEVQGVQGGKYDPLAKGIGRTGFEAKPIIFPSPGNVEPVGEAGLGLAEGPAAEAAAAARAAWCLAALCLSFAFLAGPRCLTLLGCSC